MFRNRLCLSVLLVIFCGQVRSWDTDELEIFDVVEEVNENFYTVMGISQVSLVLNFDSLAKAFNVSDISIHSFQLIEICVVFKFDSGHCSI